MSLGKICISFFLATLCVNLVLAKCRLGVNEASGFGDKGRGEVSVVSLTPLSGVLADVWWLKMNLLERENDFEGAIELAEKIKILKPYNSEIWEFLSWNIGFNMFAESAGDFEFQKHCLRRSVEYLLQGIEFNPGDYKLYAYLSRLIYMKLNAGGRYEEYLLELLKMRPSEYAYKVMKRADPIGNRDYLMSLLFIRLTNDYSGREMAREVVDEIEKAFPEYKGEISRLRRENFGS